MTDDSVRIRLAEPRDRKALIGILHRCWDAAFAPQLAPAATERYRAGGIAEGFVAEEGAAILVAESGGAPVGLAHAEGDLITAMQVDPGHWGRGIGRALLAAAERQIAANGHAVARLEVDDFNQRAQAMYRAAGYVETGRRPDTEYRSGTATIMMQRTLQPALRPWRPEDRALGSALFDSNVPRFFAVQERQDFIDFVDDLPGPYFVLEDAAGEAVGCGGYAAAEGDASVAVLCWGMVRADRHRAGLGTVLLTERLDRIAADPAFRSAAIETTQHSRGFFARHGFVQTRQVPDGFAPGMDLVEMTLNLEAYRQSRPA
jgi:ribosomal protein S18 acetylase RimI-like enzyme/predicted GNAT family N-acyltransferase